MILVRKLVKSINVEIDWELLLTLLLFLNHRMCVVLQCVRDSLDSESLVKNDS